MSKISFEELDARFSKVQSDLPVGSLWRHYKGDMYQLVGITIIEASLEIGVLYSPVNHHSLSFMRPLSDWYAKIVKDGETIQRFSKV